MTDNDARYIISPMPNFFRLLTATAVLLLFFNVAVPSILAQGVPSATSIQCDDTFRQVDKPQCLTSLTHVYQNVLNVIMGLAGFASFIFLIIGGFKYLTSQGDPKALGTARTTVTWALGGLAMIIVSYLIIYVIANYTGVTQIQNFQIPTP